jgi:DNA-binding transcriptional regulator YiaG
MAESHASAQPAHILSRFVASLHTLAEDMTGNEARAIREGMGLSRPKLALHVGVDPSTIRRWEERGSHQVPRMYALALRWLLHERFGLGDNGDPPAVPKVNNG